ncbi:transglutaminase family protein [Futiania mangrovi]|uniref:Transglutaminase family protein n=1 Tax=Futiania mangrovi TaxID=2959716 RepID=A0A9J6PG39_9PROT|nr:transglutaminase family protein [Futiania mangrovii]MCP1336784.1 transglutaminase family protein [Futiania mangrovii]
MIHDVRQTTRYAYALPVPTSRQVLRLLPADRPGQRVLAAHLDVAPAPTAPLREERDFFGNRMVHLALDRPHRELALTTTATVEVTARPLPAIGDTPPWEEVRDLAAVSRAWGPDAPAHFLMPSRAVPLTRVIADYVRDTFMDGGWILAASLDLMSRIHADMAYVPGATEVTSPPGDAFAQRAGVCQDFAHIMIDGLRGLGLPARYVSGYLRTEPPEGQPRLVGADATHAWVEVWCGPEAGWIGLDPTNNMAAGGEDHIVLAIGRDYADVAPVEGVVVASGGHTLEVGVDVVPRG